MAKKFTTTHKELGLKVEIDLIHEDDIEGLILLKDAESPGTENQKQEYGNSLLSCCKDGASIIVIKEKTKKIIDHEVIGNAILIRPDFENKLGIYSFNWHKKLYEMDLVIDFLDLFFNGIETIGFEKLLIPIRKEQDMSILSEYGFNMFEVKELCSYKIRPESLNFMKTEKFMEFNF